MTSSADWRQLNLDLIAKSLQELSYEQVLVARRLESGPESEVGLYELALDSGVTYQYRAWRGVWTDLKVQSASIRRNGEIPESAGQFFVDAQKETGMNDIILANYLEEMHNTLYADLAVLKKSQAVSAREMVSWSGEKIQTVLKGHPKLLLNKGRIGWGANDQDHYGPEHAQPLQLLWLAVNKNLCTTGIADDLSFDDILRESFTDKVFTQVQDHVRSLGMIWGEICLLPVHPWQWQRYLKIHYASYLASGEMQFLGPWGDLYAPQISLRTFSNISRPEKMDIKLPLTILNTSAIRGIPGKYMAQGPALSSDLSKLCQQDPDLATTQVLEEKAGISVPHPLYRQLPGAPYRYNEFLGVLWRHSSFSKLQSDEKAIIAGSLFHQDAHGASLIGAYIQDSGVETTEWLRAYFRTVVRPLYHLQAQYGLGLVAHGQNVVIRLNKSLPSGLLLKDFQGDLRMTTTSTALSHDLTRLPANYLIHDLLTGHFVTVLRFISETLKECDGFSEDMFYHLLGAELQAYLKDHPQIPNSAHFKDINLLMPSFPRVLVNKVRFKIGYADAADRPVPMLGDELKNPLFGSLHPEEVL